MTDPPAPASSPANGYQGFRQGFLTTDTDPFTAQRREGATPEMAEHSVITDPLDALTAAGVSIWLDDLSRDRLTSGSLATLVRDQHVVGVTTNPTIFATAITGSDAYTAQIRDLAARGAGVTEALRELTATDVRDACDVLRPVYDATDGVDGRVSIEVDPRLADDTEATIAQARVLWRLVDRPNLYIKIPATQAEHPRDHRLPGRRDQRERHPDLLPGPVRRGPRCVPRRPAGRASGRSRAIRNRVGGLVLRQPRRHRDRPAAR